MIHTTILYTIDPAHLNAVKKSASIYLKAIPPGLRIELCARALNFGSWAAMKVSTLCRRPLNIKAAADFASSREISIDPLDLHRTMAGATLLRVAAITPELHHYGVHPASISLTSEEVSAVRENHQNGEAYRQYGKARLSKFASSRAQLFECQQADQTLGALALFSKLVPTKAVGLKARSSYGIKHDAERRSYDLGDGVVFHPKYVSHVDAIVAAIDGCFPTKHHGGNSPNVSIGITAASLRSVEAE